MYRPLRIPSVHPGGLPECPAPRQPASERLTDELCICVYIFKG